MTDHAPASVSWKAVLLKWISSFAIAVLFLTCLVHSKLTLLALSEAMSANNSLDLIDRSRIFVMLQIIALVPHAINIVRGIWCGLLRRDRKCPAQLRKWILATVLSILESFGICLFVFCFPGLSKPHHTILLMNCVFFVPLLDNLRCLWINRRWEKINLFWAMALIAELLGIGFTGYLLRNVPVRQIWTAPVGVVCVSIPWIPSVQKYLVENTIETRMSQCSEDPENEPGQSTSAAHNQASTNSSTENLTKTETVTKTERTAWKLTTWMSFVKLLSTVVFSMTIYSFDTLSPFPKGLVDIQTYRDGWLNWRDGNEKEFFYVLAHMIAGFIGYLVGYVACATRSQRLGFSVPLMAATPLSVVLLSVFDTCKFFLLYPGVINGKHECTITDTGIHFLTLATFFLVLAQVFSTWWLLFRSQLIVLLGEDQLFWTPMYNSALLEHWIMLSRRNKLTDKENMDLNPKKKAKRSRIFICTTMYRETEEEMQQLLKSLQKINDGVTHYRDLQFESHILLDEAVSENKPTAFLTQLVDLVCKTFGIHIKQINIDKTPYGMSLKWKQCKEEKPITIHLKDNSKVKNKKRWSQVMYMSFVLEYWLKNGSRKNATMEDSYILTTDGDVRFTRDNVEALYDLITRDHCIGAVCARTHPLGSGPVVWYQKFEYAIGHWFQKAAEHVFGCVLCSPGCFSVFRCKAIKEVLDLYATEAKEAEDFLTRDMGEDRWLCTLMIQKGWRIEYCAASENKTQCPDNFDEFFKQRRRWIASTLANLWLLIKEWKLVRQHDLQLSYLFLVYQVILLLATLLGPSSIILVVSGGLVIGENWNFEATLSFQLVLCACFTIICLYTSQNVQLYAAKCLTCVYAVIMMIVIVGTSMEIITDIQGDPGSEDNFISDKIRISTTSVYLFLMAGIVIVAGVLHLREITCLFYGLIYLLFLPSGYLILIIYSICNITDSSWGTRESTNQVLEDYRRKRFNDFIQSVCFCCSGKENQTNNDRSVETRTYGAQGSSATVTPNGLINQTFEPDTNADPKVSNGQSQQKGMPHDVSPHSSGLRRDEIQEQQLLTEHMKKAVKVSKQLFDFWKGLKYPLKISQSAVPESDDNMRGKLPKLRNKWLAYFCMINLLWLVLIAMLVDKGQIQNVFGCNPVVFCVIVLYGFVLIVQFFAMTIHRTFTLMHFLGRTPYKCNRNRSTPEEYPGFNASDFPLQNRSTPGESAQQPGFNASDVPQQNRSTPGESAQQPGFNASDVPQQNRSTPGESAQQPGFNASDVPQQNRSTPGESAQQPGFNASDVPQQNRSTPGESAQQPGFNASDVPQQNRSTPGESAQQPGFNASDVPQHDNDELKENLKMVKGRSEDEDPVSKNQESTS